MWRMIQLKRDCERWAHCDETALVLCRVTLCGDGHCNCVTLSMFVYTVYIMYFCILQDCSVCANRKISVCVCTCAHVWEREHVSVREMCSSVPFSLFQPVNKCFHWAIATAFNIFSPYYFLFTSCFLIFCHFMWFNYYIFELFLVMYIKLFLFKSIINLF